jgi:NADH:ubiquinone oxidoreductase subunit E
MTEAAFDLEKVVGRYGGSDEALIPMLQDIQAQYNYLPEGALKGLADRLGVPLARVYGVATFYKAFSLKPRGKHIVHVCLGTACHVRGAVRILDGLKRRLGVDSGETTPDMQVTLETVNCLGSCALGPLVVVDQKYHGKTTAKQMEAEIDKLIGAAKSSGDGEEGE